MKRPLSFTPITVPTVGTTTTNDVITDVYVGNLVTNSGPEAFRGRHAMLFMSPSQAECLVHDLAAKLGMVVS